MTYRHFGNKITTGFTSYIAYTLHHRLSLLNFSQYKQIYVDLTIDQCHVSYFQKEFVWIGMIRVHIRIEHDSNSRRKSMEIRHFIKLATLTLSLAFLSLLITASTQAKTTAQKGAIPKIR